MDAEPVQVIVLNGGSSSGKTVIARCLQAILPRPWLRLSVDDFDRTALPRRGRSAGRGPRQPADPADLTPDRAPGDLLVKP
ncbi:MAG: phosphotransferase-like protein [Streptosporangiaceae bacterium]